MGQNHVSEYDNPVEMAMVQRADPSPGLQAPCLLAQMQLRKPISVCIHLHKALYEIYVGLHLILTPCSFKETWQGPRVPQRPGHSSFVCNCMSNYNRKAKRNLNRRASPSPKLLGHMHVLAQCIQDVKESLMAPGSVISLQ